MPRYRTEIIVPRDRYVCLQLPLHWPEGCATVTVSCSEPDPAASAKGDTPADQGDLGGPDDEDIEWWEEFDGEPSPPPD